MIQFNLLPDVKIEYIKTRYRKRLMMFVSVIVSAVFLGIFIILFLFVRVNQKIHMKNLDKDVTKYSSEINKTEDLNKILTLQNQLNRLPELHGKKIVASRLVDYLVKVTPNGAKVSNVTVDFAENTIQISGEAPSLVAVNTYTDALKYTEYKVNGTPNGTTSKDPNGRAFKNVVLSSFSIPGAQSAISTYTIDLGFDPIIFAQITGTTPEGSEQISLTVPSITSTSSETEKPNPFKAPAPGAATPTTTGGAR